MVWLSALSPSYGEPRHASVIDNGLKGIGCWRRRKELNGDVSYVPHNQEMAIMGVLGNRRGEIKGMGRGGEGERG